jgi:hypothetical protein
MAVPRDPGADVAAWFTGTASLAQDWCRARWGRLARSLWSRVNNPQSAVGSFRP